MTTLFRTLTAIILMYGAVFARVIVKDCAENAMENGAGYARHETDCDKFIQCQNSSNGHIQGQIRQCAFSTYWNNDLLTCVSATDVACLTDKCEGHSDGFRYKGVGNCRGYWSCVDGKSIAMCCPLGQNYNAGLGCVDNDNRECLDTCFNDIPEPEADHEEPLCDKEPVLGNPHVYRVKVSDLFTTTMPCPTGTLYSQSECGCTYFEPSMSQKEKCERELHLTFDIDERDQSGNHNHVINQNVTIENGVAQFNGINSRLIIPRFNNIEHTDTFVIRVRYSSNHMKSGHARAIVSNSDCSNIPSIMLCEDDINTYFGVGTTGKLFTYMHLPRHRRDAMRNMSEKKLEYRFTNGTLNGRDDFGVTSRPAPGYIRNVHCALHIGYAEALTSFEGEIDELEIYLCDPEL